MRVGYVLGDLNGKGAPWQYYSELIRHINSRTDITPVGIYTTGDPSTFNTELIKMDRVFPNWHTIADNAALDLVHLNFLPIIGNLPAFRCNVPVVATVHGTLHWASELPHEVLPSPRYCRRRRLGERVAKYTIDRAFTVSNSTKHVLQQCAGWSEDQIFVTYEPIKEEYFNKKAEMESRWKDRSYFLHVSSSAPKKNVPRLVEAYAQYREAVDDPHELVIAGDGWGDTIQTLQSRFGIADSTTYLGFVTLSELIDLYDHADLFIFPSLHETFGLPNIEAMARGTPVVTTRRYGIPDVVGEAAAFIESPDSVDSIASTLIAVSQDPKQLTNLSRLGEERANQFSWEHHIEKIELAYQDVLLR